MRRAVVLVVVAALLACLKAANASSTGLPVLNGPLSLKAAIAVAVSGNLDLRKAAIVVRESSAEAESARSQLLPSLSATTYGSLGDSANILTSVSGVTPQSIVESVPSAFADQNLTLMLPIYTGGRINGQVAMASLQDDSMELAQRSTGLSVRLQVVQAYTAALLDEELERVAGARTRAEEEQERNVEQKVQTGALAAVDQLREEAELADAKQQEVAQTSAAQQALVDLKAVLGVDLGSTITLSDSLDTDLGQTQSVPADLSQSIAAASSNRPDLMQAQRLVGSAQAGVSSVKGEYSPQLWAVGMSDATATGHSDRAGYTIGLAASIPLYDGGERKGELNLASAKLEEAKLDVTKLRQQVEQEVTKGWLFYQTALAEVDAANAGAAAAQQGYSLATVRYDAGKSTNADRLDALFALSRAEGDQAKAKADALDARAALLEATGVALDD